MKNEKIYILAVDDDQFNLDLIEFAFSEMENIEIIKATNGKEAIEQLNKKEIDIILLDLAMPEINGFDILEKLRNNEKYKYLPIIVVTANKEEKYRALKLGATDFLEKPVDIEELKVRTINYTQISKYQQYQKRINEILEEKVKERTKELEKAYKFAKKTEYEITLRLGRASEFRDIETGMHIKRMSHYSAKLAELYELDKKEVELILYASPLHDIGKVGIPDNILLKPGKLTKEEFEIMKQHTIIGGKILEGTEKYPTLNAGKIIALQHHERIDGKGYPYGLKGNEIHLYARIVSIADVFDALTSKRIYKPAFSLDKALSIMEEGKGTQFDSDLLNTFINNINEFIKIKEKFPDTDDMPQIIKFSKEGKI